MSETSRRPKRFDDDVLAEVARKLAPDVSQWLGDGANPDEVAGQLAEALGGLFEFDGYKLAKALADEHYYEPDSALVNVLDQADHVGWAAWRDRVAAWVAANNVRPTLKPGDRVRRSVPRAGTLTGVVVDVREATAEYVVQEDGETYPPSRPGLTPGLILPYEDVEAAG
jgi:hypothetical protein